MKEFILISFLVSCFLVACGDKITEVQEFSGVRQISANENLPYCDSLHTGDIVYLTDSNSIYYCAQNKWKKIDEEYNDAKNLNAVDTVVIHDTLVVSNTVVIKDSIFLLDPYFPQLKIDFVGNGMIAESKNFNLKGGERYSITSSNNMWNDSTIKDTYFKFILRKVNEDGSFKKNFRI